MQMSRLTPDPSFYATATEAAAAAPEQLAYVATIGVGQNGDTPPDALGVLDLDESSPSYGEIVGRTEMPNVGDELHHFGWNRCSSACHGPDRSHLIMPGFRSSRIHILNVADDPRRPSTCPLRTGRAGFAGVPVEAPARLGRVCRMTSPNLALVMLKSDAVRQRQMQSGRTAANAGRRASGTSSR